MKQMAQSFAAAVLSILCLLSASPASAQLKLNFVIPSPAAPYLLPFFIAQDLGWYKDAGLQIEESVVTGDTVAVRAVLSGSGDITYVGPGNILQAFSGGAPLRIVGSFQPIVDYRIVARRELGTDLKTLIDKRWASTGAGGMAQTLPKLMMRKQGLDDKAAQFVTVGGHAARYQAVATGTVDAALLDTITTVKGIKDGRIVLVRSVRDDFPQMGYVYLTTKASALSDPSLRKAVDIFVREGIRGARYIMDKPDEAAVILNQRMKAGNLELVTDTLKEINKLGVWGTNGGIERSVYDFSDKTLLEMDVTKAAVPYERIVDTGPVDSALAALGRR